MIRSHFVILQNEPAADALSALADGHQLFQETRTGLYYLTGIDDILDRRPKFGGFLERHAVKRVDVTPLKAFVEGPPDLIEPRISELGLDLIRQVTKLSEQLSEPVFCAQITDDDYASAVIAENGELRYLRFRTYYTVQSGKSSDPCDVIYTPDTGFRIESEFSEHFYGLAERAYEDWRSKPAPDFHRYCETKPRRETAKAEAKAADMSIKAYQDSFGVFKRISANTPPISGLKKFVRPFRFSFSYAVLPFIIIGGLSSVDADDAAGREGNLWRYGLKGFGIVAGVILIPVIIIRTMLGY